MTRGRLAAEEKLKAEGFSLLTTGIDVPAICHLVFLRRVRSRILYEQMIGRATRRCDDIGKTVFKIYDPVDIYAALQEVSTMKPLVKDAKVILKQLVEELTDPKSFEAPGRQQGTSHADDVLDALSQRVMRTLRKAEHLAGKRIDIKQKLDELEQLWGVQPGKLHKHLHEMGAKKAQTFVATHQNLNKGCSTPWTRSIHCVAGRPSSASGWIVWPSSSPTRLSSTATSSTVPLRPMAAPDNSTDCSVNSYRRFWSIWLMVSGAKPASSPAIMPANRYRL